MLSSNCIYQLTQELDKEKKESKIGIDVAKQEKLECKIESYQN